MTEHRASSARRDPKRWSATIGPTSGDEELAADLAGMRRLYELHTRLAHETDLHTALREILAAACEFARTERGCIQLVSDDGERLDMFACQGFPHDSPFVERVRRLGSVALEMVRAHGRRFLTEDVASSEQLEAIGIREVALAEGIRALMRTPLLTRRGEVIGVLSNQFSEPHYPTGDELRLLDLLAWTAADFVVRHRAEEALRRSAELSAFRVRLTDALRPIADPEEIQATASRLLGEHLGADRAFYGELTADGEDAVVVRDYAPTIASIAGRHRLDDFGASLVAKNRAGRTVVVPDVAAEPTLTDAEKRAYAALHIGAHVDVPLIKNGRLAAVFVAQQAVPRAWTPEEVQLMEEVAERTWAAVERARAEEALRNSEQRYRHLFESIDEGFCIVEVLFDRDDRPVDYRFIEANPSFASQTGIDDVVVGRTIREIIPEPQERWWEIFGRVVQTGEPKRFREESKALGRWFDAYAFPVGEPHERRVGVLFSDVTERTRVQANLALFADVGDYLMHLTDIEQTMDLLGSKIGEHFRASLCAFSEIDIAAGTFTIAYAWHRKGVPNLLGEHRMADYFSADFVRAARAGVTGVVRDTSRDPRIHASNMAAVRVGALITVPLVRDGRWRFSLTIADTRPRDWRADEVQLVRELATRIWTQLERARAEEALRHSEEQLREADERKNEFLAVLAHELRNPLAPVRTGLELIRVSGQATENVRVMMERQVGHMVRLIDDLLDVSRITSGKIRLQREPISVSTLVTNAIEANRHVIAEKQLTLSLRLPDTPCIVDVDPTRFVQVLSNLLHNAAKFTDPGGWIRVSATVGEPDASGRRQLVISVADSGIGISPELLPHVFELFHQGDRGAFEPGLGIGLALARQLVEMHGGEIEARSAGSGRGAEFLVRLPASAHRPEARSEETVGHQAIDCRVLVIDDNHDAADTMAMLVESIGGECRTAYDGESGLRTTLAYRPEVVLLDIGMPGMDGYETCRRIRRELGSDPVIVAVTGFGQDEDKQRAARAGFDAHLTKPADPPLLEGILRRCASRGGAASPPGAAR